MPSTNLIVALVFAALFGAGLVFLALYFFHSYIHKRCLELDHWFHLLIPRQLRSQCRHCEGTGRDLCEKSRSRSSQRKSRSRSRAKRGRSRQSRGGNRINEADTEWNAVGAKEGQLRGGGREGLQRPRPALPAAPTVHSPAVTEHYNPWQASSLQQYAQPAMYSQAYSQMPQQHYAQGAPPIDSHAIPAPLPPYQPQHLPSLASSTPPYHYSPRKARKERAEMSSRSRSRQAAKHSRRVRTTDFIHIVDDYPPIVKEAIRKAAQKQEPVLSSVLSSTDSSTSSEPVEQVPRVSIPQATPRFASPATFPLPQSRLPVTRELTAPTMYPPQWNHGGGPVGQARYASPYTRPGVWIPSPEEMQRPRHDPSNTRPELKAHMDQLLSGELLTSAGTSPASLRWRAAEKPEGVTRTLRRSKRANGRARPQDNPEKYVRPEAAEEVDAQKRAEAPEHPKSSSSIGSPKADNCKTTPTEYRASSHNGVPLMSPMPTPIVEEPSSDYSSATIGKLVADEKSSPRPTASTV